MRTLLPQTKPFKDLCLRLLGRKYITKSRSSCCFDTHQPRNASPIVQQVLCADSWPGERMNLISLSACTRGM